MTRAVDKTGWWGGFAITVGEVTATQGFGDAADLAIELNYENLGTQPWYAPTPTAEVDASVIESFLDNTPEVPAGGKTNAELAVVVLGDDDGQVDLEAAIDAVSLVFGDAADNQTFIPLAASAEVTSVEPKDLAVTGTLTQGEVLVDVVSGSLEPSYESGEKDKSLVNLRIKVSCGPDCSEYGYNVGRENFALTAPDGTSVTPDDRSLYCCDAIYPGTVSDSEGNVLTFLVASPGTGDYTFTFTGLVEGAPGTLAFTA